MQFDRIYELINCFLFFFVSNLYIMFAFQKIRNKDRQKHLNSKFVKHTVYEDKKTRIYIEENSGDIVFMSDTPNITANEKEIYIDPETQDIVFIMNFEELHRKGLLKENVGNNEDVVNVSDTIKEAEELISRNNDEKEVSNKEKIYPTIKDEISPLELSMKRFTVSFKNSEKKKQLPRTRKQKKAPSQKRERCRNLFKLYAKVKGEYGRKFRCQPPKLTERRPLAFWIYCIGKSVNDGIQLDCDSLMSLDVEEIKSKYMESEERHKQLLQKKDIPKTIDGLCKK